MMWRPLVMLNSLMLTGKNVECYRHNLNRYNKIENVDWNRMTSQIWNAIER